MKTLEFIKMHGAGNDFVFIDRARTKAPVREKEARLLLDRHYGIGGDQLLVLEKKGTNNKLTIFNSDGSQAEMCGNGVRAVAYYLTQFKGAKKDFVIQTKAGPIGIGLKNKRIEVDMGRPILEGRQIPVEADGPIVDFPVRVGSEAVRVHAVSMGNPHAVIFVSDVDAVPLEQIGPAIEHNPFFPRRVNVEFVKVLSKSRLKARVWERGAGVTLACGTGACAIAVAAARAGLTNREVSIELPGGTLGVRWAENDHVYLSGPAEVTFEGKFRIP